MNDQFTEIHLCADDHGVEYNFGEIKPASVGGNVSVQTPEGKVGIEGVTIELYDGEGLLVDTVLTDAQGNYSFEGLAPGTYSILEIQPSEFLDSEESVGTVDGVNVGSHSTNAVSYTHLTLPTNREV